MLVRANPLVATVVAPKCKFSKVSHCSFFKRRTQWVAIRLISWFVARSWLPAAEIFLESRRAKLHPGSGQRYKPPCTTRTCTLGKSNKAGTRPLLLGQRPTVLSPLSPLRDTMGGLLFISDLNIWGAVGEVLSLWPHLTLCLHRKPRLGGGCPSSMHCSRKVLQNSRHCVLVLFQ